jgi:hypothetical protein
VIDCYGRPFMAWHANFTRRGADGGLRPRLRRAAALLAGTALALVAAPALANAAAGPSYWGSNLQPLLRDHSIADGQVPDYLAQLQAGQMTVSRFQIDWEYVEPNPPSAGVPNYTWNRRVGGWRESVDDTMRQLALKGVRAAPLFRSPPGWATAPGDQFPVAQRDHFAAFVAAAATRYCPGGSFWAENPDLPQLPTETYEVWNEANIPEYAWNGVVDAAAYTDVVAKVAAKVKAVQPGAQVIASLGWQQAQQYVAALGNAGGLQYLDGIGFHAYAPDAAETLALVRGLRAQLAASGAPSMPIYVNEAGQFVTYSGAGNQFGFQGWVSDGARAAALSFAGDALANSDCGVQQFMNYAITGTETEQEPIHEGFMGMLRHADAQPNVTGAAMQRASRRWVAKVASGLPPALGICGGGGSQPQSLLPIDVTVTGTATGCVSASARYDGNPLESATLVLSRWDGSRASDARTTDAFGNISSCVPFTERGRPFNVRLELPNAGVSGTVACDVETVGCPVGAALTPGAGRLSAAASTKQKLAFAAGGSPVFGTSKAWKLSTIIARPVRNKKTRQISVRVKLNATCATCVGVVGQRVNFVASYKRKGKKERKLKTLSVTVGTMRTATLRAPLRQGDKLILLHRAAKSPSFPRLRAQITLRKPATR